MRTSEFRWAQVRVGLFVSLAVIVLFAFITYAGLAGTPFVRRIHVVTLLPDASGLALGSPVEMGGVKIGEVSMVDLPIIESGRVPVHLAIEKRALDRLGPSSQAFVASHALVGQRFVGLTTRRPDEQVLPPDAVIPAREERDLNELINVAGRVLDSLDKTLVDVRRISSGLAGSIEGDGSLGLLLRDRELYESMRAAATSARDAAHAAAHGPGALPTLLNDAALARELRSGVGSLADTARRVRAGEGVLGRLTANEAAAEHLEQTLANLDAISTNLAGSEGALGALIGDPAIRERVETLLGQVDSLVADVRRNPKRYLTIQPF